MTYIFTMYGETNSFHFVPILHLKKLRPREVSESTGHVKKFPVEDALSVLVYKVVELDTLRVICAAFRPR
jgi:hypothetical protein